MSTILEAVATIEAQIESRIELDLQAFNNRMPERHTIAWHAYLAGLSEWSVIDFQVYQRLVKMLPKLERPDPIDAIMLGRD